MELNTVAYLCKGCGIAEALDMEKLEDAVKEGAISEVKTSDVLCSPEGVAMIQADIDGGVNGVMLVACSARFKTDEFDFGPDVTVERTPVRDQVAWALEAEYEGEEEPGEDRQMAAEDYIRMSSAKMDKCKPVVPFKIEGDIEQSVMVIGGGPAGLAAALQAAGAGHQVYLVEKEAELGGYWAKMAKLGPQSPPYNALEDTGVAEKIAEVTASDKIKVFTGATVAKTAGQPGQFEVELSNGETFKTGAVVQATGWLPYPKENLKEELATDLDGVLSNVEFEEKAKAGDLGGLNAVAFVQCAGSRDQNHLPYCSAVCCLVSMKQAMYVKEQNPEAAVYFIFKDVRTPEQSEEVYREAQRRGVIFLRRPEDEYPQIAQSGGKLSLTTKDVLLDDTVELDELDMVVLATGMKPNNPKVVEPPLVAFGMDQEAAKKLTAEAKAQSEDWSVLGLGYRQGKNLPTLKYAMPDSHFICFPYETRRTGIYTAGAVRRPMRLTQAQEDGTGAALKAVQAIVATENSCAVHPRSGDTSFPDFFMQRCTQCKRCTEECPFGAINEDEKANPLPNRARCRRCGTCMGACPERIISFANYSVDMVGSMIKSIEVPDEDEEKPRVLAFICENDALPALEMAVKQGKKISPYIRFLPVRCLGSLNLIWIADSLSSGIDAVMLLGCRRGDDYQCHFIKGSELANVRMSKISETLDRLALESERVQVAEIAINDVDKLVQVCADMMEKVEEVGPNPYKGF